MLLRFTAENYKLFDKRTEISLDASTDRDLPDNISVIETPKRRYDVLRYAMIYGANASGKTVFFEAIQLMRTFVCMSHTSPDDAPLTYTPYIGSEECRPTSFEIEFIDDGIRYIYGFSYDSKRVTEEHLIHFPNGRGAVIFKRDTEGYTFPSDKASQENNARHVKPHTLYVSVSAQSGHEASVKIVDWFSKNLITMVGGSNITDIVQLIGRMDTDKRFAALTKRALFISDLGIDNIYGDGSNIRVEHIVNGRHMDLPLVSESSGTIRFLTMIGHVIDALLSGKVLVIDDLDLSLHTELCRWIVNLFSDPSENRTDAQLIFSTYDTGLLDLHRARRDQIWFMEKDHDSSASTLNRLSCYKGIRKDLDIRKAYLNGSLGAVPFIEPETLMYEPDDSDVHDE